MTPDEIAQIFEENTIEETLSICADSGVPFLETLEILVWRYPEDKHIQWHLQIFRALYGVR